MFFELQILLILDGSSVSFHFHAVASLLSGVFAVVFNLNPKWK